MWLLLSCLSTNVNITPQEPNLYYTLDYIFMHDYIRSSLHNLIRHKEDMGWTGQRSRKYLGTLIKVQDQIKRR